jgi:glycosyltransferase involved in cell wall biosynthesis
MNPVASVVLPAYNATRFLRESVESMLVQTFTDFELVVIDDCSTDDTWAMVQEYAARDPRVVALRNERNLKLAKTLNRGIAAARGRFIIRMDADDVSEPDRVRRQVEFLEAHPEVGIVGSTMRIVDEEGAVLGMRRYHLAHEDIRRHIFLYSPFCHPATAMRKEVLDRAGLYDPEYNPAEDYELYFRIGMHANFANLEEPLLRYRVVKGTSMTTGATRRMERTTIAVRRKYAHVPPYSMRWVDRVYNELHHLSLYLVPSGLKSWLFSRLRNI